MRSLTWLSCSATVTGVNMQYAYNGIKDQTFTNSCSGVSFKNILALGISTCRKQLRAKIVVSVGNALIFCQNILL